MRSSAQLAFEPVDEFDEFEFEEPDEDELLESDELELLESDELELLESDELELELELELEESPDPATLRFLPDLKSVSYQPLPLSLKPGAESSFFSVSAPHFGHSTNGSSDAF